MEKKLNLYILTVMEEENKTNRFIKGKIEEIETYRDFKIVIEHNLNIFEKTKDEEEPIYTICGMGRCYQGKIEDVRIFIDNMYIKYGNNNY